MRNKLFLKIETYAKVRLMSHNREAQFEPVRFPCLASMCAPSRDCEPRRDARRRWKIRKHNFTVFHLQSFDFLESNQKKICRRGFPVLRYQGLGEARVVRLGAANAFSRYFIWSRIPGADLPRRPKRNGAGLSDSYPLIAWRRLCKQWIILPPMIVRYVAKSGMGLL
ncbi:hypothetical protein [Methylocapsa sp. S129]|uniref:hypothetical protein n=1 Tax=Methylocapsa sp. S129 TaxID=1641869 RepID=UPI00131D4CBB|nr:hypothetical protein [Methylocapsa sp. S129]